MNAKDCTVMFNGQPLQNYILMAGEPPSMTIQGINPYAALGIMRAFYKAEEARILKGMTYEPAQPQGARIEIGGVTIDPQAFARAQDMARREDAVEVLAAKVEEMQAKIKSMEEKKG